MIGTRYTSYQISRVNRIEVILKHRTQNRDYYQTKLFEKGRWKAHEVIVDTQEGVSLRERFNCDCWWGTNKTPFGDKFCSCALAVLKLLCEEEVIDKSIWRGITEGEFIY